MRIQFPDHWVLQGSFQPHESCEQCVIYYIILHHYIIVRELVKFVREHLANPAVKFYLCKFML